MPIRWETPWLPQKFALVCQKAESIGIRSIWELEALRYLTIFISGEFSLEEADAFAMEAFDHTVVPEMSKFFENQVDLSSFAFSVSSVPLRLRHLVDTYSTVDFVDEYTFHLMQHVVDRYFEPGDAEEKALRRMRKTRLIVED